MTLGHEHRAGVAAHAGQLHAQGARRRDALHHPDREVLLFEQRPLLDVQLDEGGIAAGFEPDRCRVACPCKPAARRNFSSVLPSPSRNAAAFSSESVPASIRLPRQPMPKRVGSSAVKTIEFEGGLRLEAAASAATGRPRCAPRTPTTPSYLPALGMASMCEPVATGGAAGRGRANGRRYCRRRLRAGSGPRQSTGFSHKRGRGGRPRKRGRGLPPAAVPGR